MRPTALWFATAIAAFLSAPAAYFHLPKPPPESPLNAPTAVAKAAVLELHGTPVNVERLEAVFAEAQYDLGDVVGGRGRVPRILVGEVPQDLGDVPEVPRRKALFLATLLPIVMTVNEQIVAERAILEQIAGKIERGQRVSIGERMEINRIARAYDVIGPDDGGVLSGLEVDMPALMNELLERVAPMPVSLTLAQAAEESAWGLSRFATEGNALFGEYIWDDEIGMLPQRRRAGATHSLKPFRDLMEATLSYARNLNTHRAYEGFRDMRAKMLAAGKALDGAELAATLTRYSERGGDYVTAVRNLIRSNNLAALDAATFDEKLHLTQMARNELRDSES